jgi:hypothetical protein
LKNTLNFSGKNYLALTSKPTKKPWKIKERNGGGARPMLEIL